LTAAAVADVICSSTVIPVPYPSATRFSSIWRMSGPGVVPSSSVLQAGLSPMRTMFRVSLAA